MVIPQDIELGNSIFTRGTYRDDERTWPGHEDWIAFQFMNLGSRFDYYEARRNQASAFFATKSWSPLTTSSQMLGLAFLFLACLAVPAMSTAAVAQVAGADTSDIERKCCIRESNSVLVPLLQRSDGPNLAITHDEDLDPETDLQNSADSKRPLVLCSDDLGPFLQRCELHYHGFDRQRNRNRGTGYSVNERWHAHSTCGITVTTLAGLSGRIDHLPCLTGVTQSKVAGMLDVSRVFASLLSSTPFLPSPVVLESRPKSATGTAMRSRTLSPPLSGRVTARPLPAHESERTGEIFDLHPWRNRGPQERGLRRRSLASAARPLPMLTRRTATFSMPYLTPFTSAVLRLRAPTAGNDAATGDPIFEQAVASDDDEMLTNLIARAITVQLARLILVDLSSIETCQGSILAFELDSLVGAESRS
nr:hypothetical protein CFP56_21575 [Quercus suber]